MNDYILGLDVSTSNVGWCILDPRGELIAADAIILGKIKDVYLKVEEVRNVLKSLSKKYSIKKVVIEENLQAFRPGFSSAKTLITLARFNGMISLVSYEIFEFEPSFVNVNHARKIIGLKINRKSSLSTKEQVLEFVQGKVHTKFDWPMRTLKSGRRKGLVLFADSCYDIADAYVVALSCVINE